MQAEDNGWTQNFISCVWISLFLLTESYKVLAEGSQIHPTLVSPSTSSAADVHHEYEKYWNPLPYPVTDENSQLNLMPSSLADELKISPTSAASAQSEDLYKSMTSASSSEFSHSPTNLYQIWGAESESDRRTQNSENFSFSNKADKEAVIMSSKFVPSVTIISTTKAVDNKIDSAMENRELSGIIGDYMLKTDSNASEEDIFSMTDMDASRETFTRGSATVTECKADKLNENVCSKLV